MLKENEIELVKESDVENIEPQNVQPDTYVEDFEIYFNNETCESKISSLINIDVISFFSHTFNFH